MRDQLKKVAGRTQQDWNRQPKFLQFSQKLQTLYHSKASLQKTFLPCFWQASWIFSMASAVFFPAWPCVGSSAQAFRHGFHDPSRHPKQLRVVKMSHDGGFILDLKRLFGNAHASAPCGAGGASGKRQRAHADSHLTIR